LVEHYVNASPQPEPNPAQGRAAAYRLHRTALAGLVFVAAWFIYKSGGELTNTTLVGLLILGLASAPALAWAAKRRPWFPVFEITCLTYIAFYAIPLLSNHSELAAFPASVNTEAGLLVAVFLAMANLGFATSGGPVRAPEWATSSLLPEGAMRHIPVGQTINTVYVYCYTFTDFIPREFEGTFRALFFGLGTICTFILARQIGAGSLSRRQATWFVFNLSAQVVFLFAQLYLIGGISLIALALIGYASAKRSIPWVPVMLVLPLVALLHLGKPDMRAVYWQGGKPLPTLAELPAFFGEWIDYSIEPRELRINSTLFERASLIQMLCLSVDRVPSLKPYMAGESYIDIPAQFVPRFIWPDKPSGLLSNVRLALYFNLVSIESATSVSIAFGVVAEAYVNFGFIGVAGLGLGMGMIFRRLSVLSQSAPMFSSLGILMILLTAWSFQIELVMATWLGSLFQASVVCIGLPLAYRRFTFV
jgi:hypothetical protein